MIHAWMLKSPFVEERRAQRYDRRLWAYTIITIAAVVGLLIADQIIRTSVIEQMPARACHVSV